jgi:RHS repeat-associated protein
MASQYTYLPNGLRITKPSESGSDLFSYLYDGSGILAAFDQLPDDGGTQSGLFLWGPTGVAMCYSPRGSVAYTYDPSGNRVCTPNANDYSGSLEFYDAYGEVQIISGLDTYFQNGPDEKIYDLMGYKSQEGCIQDWDTMLVYCQNRYYSRLTGRWLTPDPIGLDGGLNVYSFCGNNPLMFSDPSGLDEVIIHQNSNGFGMGSHALVGLVDAKGRVTWYGYYPSNPGYLYSEDFPFEPGTPRVPSQD